METIEEVKERLMFTLIAPDGTPQPMIMNPDPIMCLALLNMLAAAGVAEPFDELIKKGFSIKPVIVTITAAPEDPK